MKHLPLALIAFSIHATAAAGFGGMGNVGGEESGPIGGGALAAVLIGAVAGYFAERAFNKAKLDREGAKYSSEYLGGKLGAVVGAVGLPLLIGLLR